MKPEVKSKGRPRTNQAAFDKIQAAGERRVSVSKKEWRLATPPGAHILRRYLRREYEVKTLKDNSGWVVQRVV